MLSPSTSKKKKSINQHSSQVQIKSGGVLYNPVPNSKARCSITEPVVLLKCQGSKQFPPQEKLFPFGRQSLNHSSSSEFSSNERKGRASPQNIEELVIRKIRIEQIFRREKSPMKIIERSSSNPPNIFIDPNSIPNKNNTSVRSPPQKPKKNLCFLNKIEIKVSPTRGNPLRTSVSKKEEEQKKFEDILEKKDKRIQNVLAEPNNDSSDLSKAKPRSKSRLRPMSPIERRYNQNIRFLNSIERPKSLDEDDHLYTLKMVQIPPKQRNIQSATTKKSSIQTTTTTTTTTTTHNQEAIDSFGVIYKNVLREKELVEQKLSEQTPIRAIVFHENSVNSLPLKYGIVKKRSNSKVIDISHYHLGDRGIIGFCVGLKELKNLQSLNLKENGLSEKGIGNVFSCININLQDLDVSSNEVSLGNIKSFFDTFDITNVQLHTIKMNKAQITDETADCLFTGLQYFKTLKILQLNGNRISNRSCYSIEDMIELLPNLKELDLSWNIIQSEGGTLILDASRKQNSLQILNLAQNLLGFGENTALFNAAFTRLCCGEGQKSQFTSSITDLNMSFNQFSQKQSNKLLSIKQKNTSISNFNFQGNVIEAIPKFETIN